MPFGNAVGEGFNNSGIVIANKVIVFGPGQGVFVYSGTPALGNPPTEAMTNNTVDPYGNAVNPGVSSRSGSIFSQLINGVINFMVTGQFSPGSIGTFGISGECGITSGLATNTDSAANIVVDSAQASGIAVSLIALQSSQTQLVSGGSNIPWHDNLQTIGTAPATYTQSYENAMATRLNAVINTLLNTHIGAFP